MRRIVLRANGDQQEMEVGDHYDDWNKIINANIGEIVNCPSSNLQLWVDEEGLLKKDPKPNYKATLLSGVQIVGDAIAFQYGDLK